MPSLALYHYPSCYYCRMVVQAARQFGLELEMRNIHDGRKWRDELVAAQGRSTVPVLLITQESGSVVWMPESREIVRYLRSLAGN